MATKRPLVNNAGTLNEIATGDTLLASGFSIPSGTSTQFLKADGTADNTTYTVNSEVTRASIRPSLLLDFANSKTLDPRITFTRNSTASYYGKDGLLKTAAINSPRFDHNPTTGESLGLLIEEQRTNLLTYSENFNFGSWISVNSTILPNIGISPSGLYNSVKCVATSTNGSHSIYLPSSVTIGNIYTQSVFFKAGEYTKAAIAFNSNNGAFTNAQTVFDLITGTIIVSSAETAGIIYVGNGWYRCYASKTALASTVSVIELRAYANSEVFIGDNISGIYIWGAQLEVGAFPTSYIPSTDTFTSRATTGTYIGSNGLIQTAAINTARYNYNPLNLALSPKLLLESASTNLLTYSEQFDNASWNKNNTTITANAITAPDGTSTADKFISTAGQIAFIFEPVSITAGSTYTLSVYAKAAENSTFSLGLYNTYFGGTNNRFSLFNLTTLSYSSVSGTTAPDFVAMHSVGNGWVRCSITGTSISTIAVGVFQIRAADVAGDGTSGIYIWGAQLEVANSPTSYIPTTSAQVTRAADISSSAQSTRIADSATMTGTNFSSWYRQDEGTVVINSSKLFAELTVFSFVASINDGTPANELAILWANSINMLYLATRIIDVNTANIGANGLTQTANNLISGAYKFHDFAVSNNANTVAVSSTSNVPLVNRLSIGSRNGSYQLNGRIAKLAYYPKRLPNTELQALTTQ